MWTYFVHMKTATVRDLRNNFSRLEAWLAEGETVEIRKRGETIAELRKPARRKKAEPAMPDFAARRKKIWGDRCFTAEEVASMRADELEGEEG
jgi:antitoxin (DNA-binding transcriptional repressor) of toxin-antitoxin stability system